MRRGSRELGALPALTRVGLLILILAGALDVVVHITAGDHAGHSGIAHGAHVVGIVGMVFVLAGVVVHGTLVTLNRRQRAANSGGTRDAHR